MELYRKFYLLFSNSHTLCTKLNWSHYKYLLSIKDENKRNHYINLCITNSLSVRDLIKVMKDYRKKEHIEIIENKEEIYNIKENIKNPIIIKLSKEEQIKKEKELQLII